MARLPPELELDWTETGVPRAPAFDDVYFSKAGGLAESDAVFLGGCGLPKAWAGRAQFSICELGFGTGLNALAVWRAWKRTRQPHAVLHMCSIEAAPLERADAARALARFPEIADLAAPLIGCWPVRAYGPQRLWFPEHGFALTLFIGEADAVLANLWGVFDAFFLDGFAPARNGEMWSAPVMRSLARLSAPGARLASFSVAGGVRRNLEAAGFVVAKKPGFGAKRERLEAIWTAGASPAGAALASGGAGGPYYPYAACHPKRVAIIGAGIAGAACAHALVRRNVETIVLDAAADLGFGASGNPVGLVMPRLDRGGVLAEFFRAAFVDAVATYSSLGGGVFNPCGVIEHADAEGAEALGDLIADPPLPREWFSALGNGGALHRRAGALRPRAAVEALLRDAELMLGMEMTAIERVGQAWLVRGADGRALFKADAIVLACGAWLAGFEPASFLPIRLSRGQIEWGPVEGAPPTRASVRGNYVTPFADGILFGATFDRTEGDLPLAVDEASRARNLAALAGLAPELAARLRVAELHSRVSHRAAMPDRAPIAGLMPDAPAWLSQNAALAHGGEPDARLPPPALPGVYVLGGLGARGLTLAPILGERIAAEMFGEPQALSSACLALLHPARFLHRALKRGG